MVRSPAGSMVAVVRPITSFSVVVVRPSGIGARLLVAVGVVGQRGDAAVGGRSSSSVGAGCRKRRS